MKVKHLCIVTGGNRGIGYHVARRVAQRGTHRVILDIICHKMFYVKPVNLVLKYLKFPEASNIITNSLTHFISHSLRHIQIFPCLACRSHRLGSQAAHRIRTETKNPRVECVRLDLTSNRSVAHFTKNIKARPQRVDLLINNAGALELKYQISEDNYEANVASNFLGHFLNTNLLLPRMTPKARVMNAIPRSCFDAKVQKGLTMPPHEYHAKTALNSSKLYLLMSSLYLRYKFQQFPLSKVRFINYDVGMTNTDFWRNLPILPKMITPLFKGPEEASNLVMDLIDTQDEEKLNTVLINSGSKPEKIVTKTLSSEAINYVWTTASQLVGLEGSFPHYTIDDHYYQGEFPQDEAAVWNFDEK